MVFLGLVPVSDKFNQENPRACGNVSESVEDNEFFQDNCYISRLSPLYRLLGCTRPATTEMM